MCVCLRARGGGVTGRFVAAQPRRGMRWLDAPVVSVGALRFPLREGCTGRRYMTQFGLTGRVAIVTGGNGGIGLGMARGLAMAGAAIVVAGRNSAKGDAAVAELRVLGTEAVFVEADVTEEAACRALVGAAVDRFGRLDILVNNAGTNIRKSPESYALAEWE